MGRVFFGDIDGEMVKLLKLSSIEARHLYSTSQSVHGPIAVKAFALSYGVVGPQVHRAICWTWFVPIVHCLVTMDSRLQLCAIMQVTSLVATSFLQSDVGDSRQFSVLQLYAK